MLTKLLVRRQLAICLVFLFLLASCATVQDSWNKLTPDQKARIVVSDLQGQLGTAFDTAKAYVDVHPQYKDIWKSKVLPSFDVANTALAGAMKLAQQQQITPEQIYINIVPVLKKVIAAAAEMGLTLPSFK